MKKSILLIILGFLMLFITIARIAMHYIAPDLTSSANPVFDFELGFISAGCSIFLGFYMLKKEKTKTEDKK